MRHAHTRVAFVAHKSQFDSVSPKLLPKYQRMGQFDMVCHVKVAWLAPFMPTPCRRDAASAIDNPRADGPARVVSAADPCQNRRNGQSIAFDIGRDRLETLSRCAPDPAQRTSRPPTPDKTKTSNPHKPRPAHRGFVPRRLSDA
jgi:hypothetical protein